LVLVVDSFCWFDSIFCFLVVVGFGYIGRRFFGLVVGVVIIILFGSDV
jgi:hypothetical protein